MPAEPSPAQQMIGDFAPKLKDELIEAITHLAFYAGWPNAMTGILTAKNLFGQAEEHNDH
jgi:alkylhydroperoxidase/carboxymuconolactone decarboxylase family protein YurZ